MSLANAKKLKKEKKNHKIGEISMINQNIANIFSISPIFFVKTMLSLDFSIRTSILTIFQQYIAIF